MQIAENIHALRIPFGIPVGPGRVIERVVFSFLIFGDTITLIDSGVMGAEGQIFEYIRMNGRDPRDISRLILSHSHPDHVGSARAIKEATGCMVLAHQGERHWIEDTELQFRERPVPGFRDLVGGPVAVDGLLSDGEMIRSAKGSGWRVIHTPGHSAGSISLYCEREGILFSGDAIPLPNDLPVYEDIADSVSSIMKLRSYADVKTLLSSWEAPIQGMKEVEVRMEEGLSYLLRIHERVTEAADDGIGDLTELCRRVVDELGLPRFAANPLVAKAFASSLRAAERTLF